jgi:hypothetical protein
MRLDVLSLAPPNLTEGGPRPGDELRYYAEQLRNEGGSVGQYWTPGAPPDRWAY